MSAPYFVSIYPIDVAVFHMINERFDMLVALNVRIDRITKVS